jgi:voltage-gated potassium channel
LAVPFETLRDHSIVCGGGEVGRHVIADLVQSERDFVVIEAAEERRDALRTQFGESLRLIGGDATDDDVLMAAGITGASSLFSCLSGDKDNLIVTLSARLLSPDLSIAARCHESAVADKIRAAGADAVLSPHELGGRRIANVLLNPIAVSLVDSLLVADAAGTRVDEIGITAARAGGFESVGALRTAGFEGLLVLGLRPRGTQEWIVDPPDDAELDAGCSLVFMAPPATRAAMEARMVA